MNDVMKKTNTSDCYCYFPIELIIDILSRLPVKSLGRFKCVSKSWCGVINDPYFIKLHLARSLKTNSNSTFIMINNNRKLGSQSKFYSLNVNYQHPNNYQFTQLCYPKEFIRPDGWLYSSCNGLLCLAFAHKHNKGLYDINHCLYNPATRSYKLLPVFKFTLEAKFVERIRTLSLGYDCVSDDYKVLKILDLCRPSSWRDKLDQKSLLYSLKNNSWEIIEDPPWNSYVLHLHSHIFANNSFHWLSPECKEIKCFDLFTHKFYEMAQLPDNILRDAPKLGLLQGQLCLVTTYLDIWVMKEYGNKSSWTQIFRNLNRPSPSVYSNAAYQNWKHDLNVACFRDGCNIMLALTTRIRRDRKVLIKVVKDLGLICCEMESGSTNKRIYMPDLPDDLLLPSKQPWAESLVDPLHYH